MSLAQSRQLQQAGICTCNGFACHLTQLCDCSGTPRISLPRHGSKVEVYTTLAASGRQAKLYIQAPTDDVKKEGRIESADYDFVLLTSGTGSGKRGFRLWLDRKVQLGELQSGCHLLLDRATEFTSEDSQHAMDDHGITYSYFPTELQSRLSPADETLHATVKHNYGERLVGRGTLSRDEKLQLIFQSYHSVSEDEASELFVHCGLVGRNWRSKLHSLFTYGESAVRRWRRYHDMQLRQYMQSPHCKVAVVQGDGE
jgi:hypothetical protein